MTSLVSDFFINPVLRQARRFSRTTTSQADSLTNQRTPHNTGGTHDGVAFCEVVPPISAGLRLGDIGAASFDSISRQPVVSSHIDEDGGLERGLEAQGSDHPLNNPASVVLSNAIPRRFATFPPARIGVDDDATSANPDFGIPSRFDTSSGTSSPHSISIPNPAVGSVTGSRTPPQLTSSSTGPRKRDSTLPEDDGMANIRKRIILIHGMNISPAEKAKMMQELLTEGYNHSQINQNAKPLLIPHSPASLVSQDRPTTPASLGSFSFWQTTVTDIPPESSPTTSLHAFQLSLEDLEPTYAPIEPVEAEAATSDFGDSEEVDKTSSLGCLHYKRNVKLQCFTCSRWYTCRHCHDEAEDHVLNRKETRNMLCMLCKCAQRACEVCVNCGSRAAWYYCGVCHLWDDDTTKSIYHCNDCGICRVGSGIGKDFFHCKTCDVCIKISNQFSHKCIERASDCDCPVCGEYLFSSPKSVCFMKCGHSIHRTCYHDLMATTYKCPICSQSAVNMESQFRRLDRTIADQPMPVQFQDTKAMVSCNDCYAKSLVKYHWLGLKCAICDSYNTAQLRILTLNDRDAEASPGPAATALERDSLTLEHLSRNNLRPDPHRQLAASSDSLRNRRHSSHALPMLISSETGSSSFSPYLVPERIGRSVSPMRGKRLIDTPVVDSVEDSGTEDEEEVDFWGGHAVRSPSRPEEPENEEDSEESDDDTMSIDDEDEDDGEDEDHMALFGHR